MKTIRFYLILFLALAFSPLLQSCSKGFVTSPLSAGPTPNLLSAYATIGASSYFDVPAGIQYSNGHLWVANWSTYLQEWTTGGTAPVTTIWTYNSGVSFTELNGDGIDPATGNVYAVDQLSNQVTVFDPVGNFLAVFGNAQMGATTPSNSSGANPVGVAVNSAGTTVYVLGRNTAAIYVYSIGGGASSPAYSYKYTFGNLGSWPTTLHAPNNLRIDNKGYIWIADYGRIAEFTSAGSYLNSFSITGLPNNFGPADVLPDSSGNIYAVDSNNSMVFKFNSYGWVLGHFGKGVLTDPGGIATDGAGNFFVTNYYPQQIVVFH